MRDSSPADFLAKLTADLNSIARSVIEDDGEHAPMFFLVLPDGQIETRLFSDETERPVGEARGREITDAVGATNANAVVLVTEAWSASPDEVPLGGNVGDVAGARDVLAVAAVDRLGNATFLVTPLTRREDGLVAVGETADESADVKPLLFEGVRRHWGLP